MAKTTRVVGAHVRARASSPAGRAGPADKWVGLPPFPVGVAAIRTWCTDDGGAAPPTDGHYSELVWYVRGGFRSSDIGRHAWKTIEGEIVSSKLPVPTPIVYKKQYLLTRFPRVGGGVADSYQRALWTSFFNDHDFVNYKLRPEVAKKELRLRREVK